METKTKVESESTQATPPVRRKARKKQEMKFANVIKATGAVRVNPQVSEPEVKVSVWMGTQEECPFWTIHAGGYDFPRYNEIVTSEGETGSTRRERVRGKVMDLSKAEIDSIARAVGRKVIRSVGSRFFILNIDSERFRENAADRPLGEVLYMHVLTGSLSHDWRAKEPESMV